MKRSLDIRAVYENHLEDPRFRFYFDGSKLEFVKLKDFEKFASVPTRQVP